MALTEKPRKESSKRSLKSLSQSKGTVSVPEQTLYREECEKRGLGRYFLDKLNEYKDKIHQVDAVSGLTETNASVRQRSIQVAMELQERGIKENDVVLICSRAHRDQTVVVLGSLLAGAVVAPLDPESVLADFKNYINGAKPRFAFCDARVSGQLGLLLRECRDGDSCTIVFFGKGADKIPFDKFLSRPPTHDFKTDVKDPKRKIAFVVTTQGTTDQTKFVCISHHAVYVQLLYLEYCLKGAETFVSFFPLSWITQLLLTCFCYANPITRVLPGVFAERSACKLIHDLRIDTALLGTDLALRICHHHSFHDYDLSCLKILVIGGVSTTALEVAQLRGHYGAQVLQAYGLTEMAGLVSTFNIDDYSAALKKPASTGKLLPGIKVKIVDPETREVLKDGWWGELLVNGPSLMSGYFKNTISTAESMEKNYLKTGDVAQLDDEGYLYVEGRISDFVQVDGHSFIPISIEEMISTHPYVVESVVVGSNNGLVACVVKKRDISLTADMLLEYLSERLPENKIPTKVRFMESLPKTSVGKIKRIEIKQMVLEVTIEHSKSIISLDNEMPS